MATNITFDSPRSLSPAPRAKPAALTANPRYRTAIAAVWTRLATPTPLSPTGQSFHHAFKALPVPR